MDRMVQLGEPMKAFWIDARKLMIGCATWYCRAMEIPGIDFDALLTLPDPTSQEGKAFTREAQMFTSVEDGALGRVTQYHVDRQKDMMYVVTIGRLCTERKSISGWGKNERSLSNKLANSVNKEVTAGEKLLKQLSSVSSRNSEPVQEADKA
jgi:hypothetical protein